MSMAERRLSLEWARTADGRWYTLYGVDLAHPHVQKLEGVYVIWSDGPRGAVVRLGQGIIRNRLLTHRSNPVIQSLERFEGPLCVSWARVPNACQDSVERYLGLMLEPQIGVSFPTAPPISVNLPWEPTSDKGTAIGLLDTASSS